MYDQRAREDSMDPTVLALLGGHPPMPEGKEHLVYRDFPKMKLELFEWILSQLEDFELEVLTFARYEHKDGILARGQIWVHPDGLATLTDALDRDMEHLLSIGALTNDPEKTS